MLHLANTVSDVIREGYLAVPNALIHASLSNTDMAVYGGLFYTVTAGALISFLALGAANLYLLVPDRRKRLSVICIVSLGFLIFSINRNGFLALETASLILTPGLIFLMTVVFFSHDKPVFSLKKALLHGMPPVILAFILLFFVQGTNSQIFSDFRDTFLMSNPVGMKINDFYYKYTLAPAEVFKSLDQKLIKTCVLTLDPASDSNRQPIENLLLARDYLVLDTCKDPDLTISTEGDTLVMRHHGHVIVKNHLTDFLARSNDILTEFSKKTDQYQGYRHFIGIALITGLPLLMYILMHGIFFGIIRPFLAGPRAAVAASFLCPLVGLIGFTVLYASSSDPVTPSNIRQHIASPSLTQRVEALKYISDHNVPIGEYPACLSSMGSTSVV